MFRTTLQKEPSKGGSEIGAKEVGIMAKATCHHQPFSPSPKKGCDIASTVMHTKSKRRWKAISSTITP
ncbi:hypothetical protein vseg_016989 [Gypsophila vaccaria]